MAHIAKLSDLADSFPDEEVEYEDLLGLGYRAGARYGDGSGTIDCIGVVIEVLRRAGLGLPDPSRPEIGLFAFTELFEAVEDVGTLYDLVNIRREQNHVGIVVRTGTVISARANVGAYTAQLTRVQYLDGVEFFRIRSDRLP